MELPFKRIDPSAQLPSAQHAAATKFEGSVLDACPAVRMAKLRGDEGLGFAIVEAE